MVFFMEFNQQAGLVLFLQFPQIAQNLFEALLVTVGIHEVKQVLETGGGIIHVNDRDALCAPVNVPINPPVAPFIKGGKLACVRALGVNQNGVIERAFIILCHTGQQTFPLRRVFRVFLHRRFIQVGKKGHFAQDATSLRCVHENRRCRGFVLR